MQLFIEVNGVIEERARLHQHRKRRLRQVVTELRELLVPIWQQQVRTIRIRPSVERLVQVARHRVRIGDLGQLLARARDSRPVENEFANRVHSGRFERRDALTRRRDNPADLVHFIAEEIHADRVCEVSRVDVHNATADCKGPGTFELAGIHIPPLRERLLEPIEILAGETAGLVQLAAHLEHERAAYARGSLRELAQQGSGRRNHDAVSALPHQVHHLEAACHMCRIARTLLEGGFQALEEAKHPLFTDIRRNRARELSR